VLITADQLASWLLRHARTPLYPNELAAMFIADSGERLEETWRAVERRHEALNGILMTLWESANALSISNTAKER